MAEALPVGSEERKKALAEVPEWTEVDGRDAIFRKFVFANFDEAWAWMNQVASVAAQDDHHPEWFNVYNRVEVTLSTHVYNGLSLRDIKLAKACDAFFKKE